MQKGAFLNFNNKWDIPNLEEVHTRHKGRVYAYALMDNHCHLLIETKKANLSKIMHYLNLSANLAKDNTSRGVKIALLQGIDNTFYREALRFYNDPFLT
jgi:REP element-mobilizing transposase RayT